MGGKGTTFLILVLVCLAQTAFSFDPATSLIISGSTTVVAGSGDNLTITAADVAGATDTTYDGVKSLVFSGALASINPVQNPTISDQSGNRQNFGTPTSITFVKGVASVIGDTNGQMTLYRAGTSTISVTDGAISSAGKGDLAVTVSPGALSSFNMSIASPQNVGKAFTGTDTLAAIDPFGNIVTGFDASKDNVTITSSLGGTLSGLGSTGTNIFNQAADFVGGKADLSSKIRYAGTTGSGSLQAMAASGKSGVSNAFAMLAGSATKLAIQTQPSTTGTAGNPFSQQPVLAVEDSSGNIIASDNATVVSVQEGPGGPGGLQGALSVTVVNGVATFTNLMEVKAGTVVLQFTSQPSLAPATSGSIVINAAAASKLVYNQQPTNATTGRPIAPPVTVQLEDAYNNNVARAGVPVTMSLDSGTGTLGGTTTKDSNGSGLASFSDLSINAPGQKVLLASSGSLTAVRSSTFTMAPGAATQLAIATQPSNAQAGGVINPAVTVQLLDGTGSPVIADGVAVTVALDGGGTLIGTLTQTTVAGIATFNDLSIQQSGQKTLVMTSSGLASATSQPFTVGPGAAAKTAFIQQPTNATADNIIAPAVTVQLRDSFNNNVASAGVTVTMTMTSGTGTLTGTTAHTTDANGLATFNDLNIATTGDKVLTASGTGLTAGVSSTFTITPGAAANLSFVQQPSDAAVSATISPAVSVKLQDKHGNDVPNDGVSITLTLNGTGALNGTVTQNTAGGIATFNDLSVNQPGPKTLTASSSGLKSQDSRRFNITAGAATKLVIQTQPSATTSAGAAFAQQPVVAIVDASGNVVTTDNSTTVTASESTNGTPLQGTVALKAKNGIVSFTNLAFNKTGSYTLQFSSQPALTGATSNSITVGPGSAAALAFVQQPTTTAQGAVVTPAVTVQLKDAFGNDATTNGVAVALTLTGTGTLGGTSTRNTSNGLATFDDITVSQIGSKTLTASSTGLTSATSQSFNVTGGAASKLVVQRQPSALAVAGTPFTRQPIIAITDGSGNVATGDNSTVVTAQESAGGGGGLQGTLSVTAVNGLATFTDLAETKVGTVSLQFTSQPTLTPVTSGNITVNPAAASKLVFVQGPTNAAAGTTISPAVTVQLRDAFDNNVARSGVTISITLSSGTGTLSGTSTRNTNSSGIATFNNLRIDLPGQKVLTASGNGLTPAVSDNFTVGAGAPTALVFAQQPTNIISGGTIVPAVTVQLKDAGGNDVTANGVSISVSVNGTGTLKGTTTQATVNGVATFADLSVDLTGQKTLTAASPGLQSATSQAFSVAPGVANQLAFVQQPGNTVVGSVLSPAITVRIVDASGNTNIVNGTPITISLATGDSLAGTTTKTTVNGVATFDDIQVKVAGQKSLVASSPGLPAVSSTSFTAASAQAVKVTVETAADGTGTLVSAQNIVSGSSLTIYAITRDAFNNFVANAAATSWSLQNITGGVAASDLVASADRKSARFTARSAGSASIVASVSGLTSGASGVLTVTVGSNFSRVALETAPDGSGQVLGDKTVVAGNTITMYAVARDSANNFVRNVVADQWSLQNATGGIVQQDLTVAADKKSATFSGHLAGQARIVASSGSVNGTPSGLITVVAGTASKLEIAGGSSQEAQINTQFAQRLAVKVTDAFGNPIGGVTVTFTVPATGPGGVFNGGGNTAISEAAGIATAPVLVANSFAGAFTVDASVAGVSTHVSFALSIKSGTGSNIAVVDGTSQSAGVGTPYATRFKVTVKDDAGNPVGGALVHFSAPASGPSGNFPGGLVDSTRTTAAGEATSSELTANFVAGSFVVIASTESGKTVSINLTNAPGPLTRFAVESDRGGRIDTQFVGARFGIRVRALDAYDNAVTSFAESIVISSTGDLFVGAGSTPPFVSGVLSAYTVGFQKTGTFTIVATRSGGGAAGTSNSFIVGNPRPVARGLSPSSGIAGQTVITSLTGSGFLAGVTTVSLGDGIGTTTTINNDTSMTVTLQIDGQTAPGSRDVTVINAPPVGGVAFLANGFTVGDHPRPAVTSVSPSGGAQLQSLQLFVRGRNFLGNGFSHLFITGDGITIDSTVVDSSTVVHASIIIGATATLGPRDIVIVNDGPGGGNDSLHGAFAVTPGVLAAPLLSQPPNGAQNQPSTLTLSWQAAPGATSYQIQVAEDAQFAVLALFDSVTSTAYQAGPLADRAVYYWRVRAFSGAGASSWSTSWVFDNLPQLSSTISLNNVVDFPDHASQSDYTSYDYRIVGLPGASNSRLTNFISGVQDVDWRIFWDNGGASEYLIPYDGSSTFTFVPGRAFWMLKKGPWAVSVTIAAAPIDSATHAVLVTLHSGWNLITNPMTWTIPWSAVQTANNTTEPIYGFEGLYNQADNFDPYAGYYFFDDPKSPLGILKIPYGPGVSKSGLHKGSPVASDGWSIHLDLKSGKYVDRSTTLGVSSAASTGKDLLDFHRPRSFGDVPSVYFSRPEWDSLYSTFASDVRPPFTDKSAWKFTVSSKGQTNGDLELDFRGLEAVPNGMEVYLVDVAGASYHDLKKEGPDYHFKPAAPTTNFTLLVGTKEALADELDGVVPRTFALEQNYPNPFNPSTTIPVSLPMRATVDLKIYNILGQVVKSLHSGVLDAGRHVFFWDGTNSAGNAVASGMYISRLTSDSGVRLGRKMLLLR